MVPWRRRLLMLTGPAAALWWAGWGWLPALGAGVVITGAILSIRALALRHLDVQDGLSWPEWRAVARAARSAPRGRASFGHTCLHNTRRSLHLDEQLMTDYATVLVYLIVTSTFGEHPTDADVDRVTRANIDIWSDATHSGISQFRRVVHRALGFRTDGLPRASWDTFRWLTAAAGALVRHGGLITALRRPVAQVAADARSAPQGPAPAPVPGPPSVTAMDPNVSAVDDDPSAATPERPRLRDYVRWHDAYDDPASGLSIRLRHVQGAIGEWLDATRGPVRVLSACAGQGHDILGVLEARADRARVTGALVEVDPVNAGIARRRIAALGVDLAVVQADAGVTDTYRGLVPADLVLLSGIMGNITPRDIERLVAASRQLCAPGATVIWTRGAQDPDLGPDIRRWFRESGFEEVSCAEWIEGTGMRVGVNRLVVGPEPLRAGERIFTFYR